MCRYDEEISVFGGGGGEEGRGLGGGDRFARRFTGVAYGFRIATIFSFRIRCSSCSHRNLYAAVGGSGGAT